jgi:hypothetical protein
MFNSTEFKLPPTLPTSPTSPAPSSLSPLNFLDPKEFLWSFFGCMCGFCIVALRAIVWGTRYCEYHRVNALAYLSQKKATPSYAPLFLSFLLMIVLALRAIWSVVKYNVLTHDLHVSLQIMALLDHLPLLFLLSAFSRISLFWVKSFGMEKTNRVTCITWIVFSFNFLLYLATISQVTLSIWYPDFLDPHNVYYIAQLCAIALWCLILSTLFSVYGWRLRHRLGQSIHSSQQIKDTFARILAATIVCTCLFLMRGILFCFLTIRYNVYDIVDPRLNRIVFPLLVYTVPDVVSSVAILFIMDVKKDTRAVHSDVSSSIHQYRTNSIGRNGYHHHSASGILSSNKGSGTFLRNYGGVGSIVDHNHRFYGDHHRFEHSNYMGAGEAAFLDEQSPTDSVKYDWEQSHGYSPPSSWDTTNEK